MNGIPGTLLVGIATSLCIGCGNPSVDETPTSESSSPAQITVNIGATSNYAGWLYSYGLEWVECETETTWLFPSLIQSAQASHPITYDEIGQWQWHQRILIGKEQTLIFEGPLGNKKYCGLHWLFAHGGVTVDGALSSFQIAINDTLLATSHHAWTLNITFDQPLCGTALDQSVQVDVPVETWLQNTLTHETPSQNARSATLNLSEYISISTSPCN